MISQRILIESIIEAGAILNMVEDEFRHRCLLINIIVSVNCSTMQAVLKNPSIGARGQVLKSSKGKID